VNFRSLIACVALQLLLASSALAQSSFEFRNYHPSAGVNAPVYDSEGTPLSDSTYLAELWGGPTTDSLTPLADVSRSNAREIRPFIAGGYILGSSGFLSVTSVFPGTSAWLQIRAWDTRLGPTYEAVAALGIGGYGNSPLFYAQGNDPFLALPEPGAPLIGLQSFSLLPVVPEPGTWALALLGLACFASWRWLGKRSNSS
jgi:hypothetical protein